LPLAFEGQRHFFEVSKMHSFSIPGAEYSAPDQITRNSGGRRTFPTFYVEAVESRSESEKEGRPIFKDVEYVKILIAGDQKTEVVKKVSEQVKQDYRQEYLQWKATQQQSVVGTPIEQWPGASVSFVKTCKVLNVFTVEALAQLDDSALQRLGMGSRDMQARARAWLSAAKDGAETERLAAENNRLQDQIDSLQTQIKEMGARFSELQSDSSPRKSR
jgi:hypothetical protein